MNFKEKLKQSLMEVQKKAAAGQLDMSKIQVDAKNCKYRSIEEVLYYTVHNFSTDNV